MIINHEFISEAQFAKNKEKIHDALKKESAKVKQNQDGFSLIKEGLFLPNKEKLFSSQSVIIFFVHDFHVREALITHKISPLCASVTQKERKKNAYHWGFEHVQLEIVVFEIRNLVTPPLCARGQMTHTWINDAQHVDKCN